MCLGDREGENGARVQQRRLRVFGIGFGAASETKQAAVQDLHGGYVDVHHLEEVDRDHVSVSVPLHRDPDLLDVTQLIVIWIRNVSTQAVFERFMALGYENDMMDGAMRPARVQTS